MDVFELTLGTFGSVSERLEVGPCSITMVLRLGVEDATVVTLVVLEVVSVIVEVASAVVVEGSCAYEELLITSRLELRKACSRFIQSAEK